MADEMVLRTQKWLNRTYGGRIGYGDNIPENGVTGWTTIHALTRALQIELGITSTADNFGPSTIAKFNSRFPNGVQQQSYADETEDNIYGIIQGACWCKGYSTTATDITRHFFDGTGNAIRALKLDAGMLDTSSTVTVNIMKALLSMDYFVCSEYNGGEEKIRTMQQYLNRNYEDYIGIRPCDGVFGRSTNEAIIYALQAEEGMSTSVANGNFGPSTRRYCPTIPYDNVATDAQGGKYANEKINKFITLLKIALYANGFGDGILTNQYDVETVKSFQEFYGLNNNGVCSLQTWLSLLVSCGDTSRSVKACDCATILTKEKAETLYKAGYTTVGRYLSGFVVSGASKALTREELKIIFDAGLSVFLIFQESANTVNYFTEQKATEDIRSAIENASNLGIPRGETIYFAVDCDPQEYDIINYVLPYFKKIREVMANNYNNKYVIGVYGTRNVCTKVSKNGYALHSFVSDMSSGYSGNMGFKLPNNWSFDQIATVTVGSGAGQIEIDKDAMSGRHLGFNNKFYLSDIGRVYSSLVDMFNLAMQYTNNDITKSNKLVLQCIRNTRYGDTDLMHAISKEDEESYKGKIADYFMWSMVGGEIDSNYCELVEDRLYGLTFEFKDPTTNVTHDLPHLAAALNALIYQSPLILAKTNRIVDAYAGWGGDTISFAKDIKEAVNNGTKDYLKWAKENIATQGSKRFGIQDYIDDIDAVNLSKSIKIGLSLPAAFKMYYIDTQSSNGKHMCETRSNEFKRSFVIPDLYESCQEINSTKEPVCWFKELIAGKNTEQEYIDAAISAFMAKVDNEINAGR